LQCSGNKNNVFRYSCLDVTELTKAEIEGREQAMNALIALKNVVPGNQIHFL